MCHPWRQWPTPHSNGPAPSAVESSLLLDAPWSTLRAATALRAELFAAQTRQFLKREFDEEWWHSQRAARFIRDELWRPARRHTAEDLLGFMGFNPANGLDATVVEFEIAEVLAPL